MTPIRPNAFPAQSGPAPVADAARTAAQKAFFDAAMGRSAPPAAPAAPPAPAFTAPAAPVQRAELRPATVPAEPPAKLLRPGSLLDIRV